MQRRAQSEASAPMAWGAAVTPIAARRPSPRSARHHEFDGYTAIAVLAIMVFTVYQFCNVSHFLYRGTPGYTLLNSFDAAVPWFFVLAAYRLFEPIARAAVNLAPPVSNRTFLVSRAVQIVPTYYVVVAVVWFSRQHSLPGDWRDLIEHLTFTQVFDEKRIFYTNGPAWAISVLVLFCLLLSVLNVALTKICRRLERRRTRVAVLSLSIAILAIISLSWKAWSFAGEHRPTTGSFVTWFGPAANLDNFAIGMAVALIAAVVGDSYQLKFRQRLGLRFVAIAILVAAFAAREADSWSSVYFSTGCSIAFGCLIAAVALDHRKVQGPKRSRPGPLAAIAAIAYGTYLWHEPVLLWLRSWDGAVRQAPDAVLQDTVVVISISVLAGWLSHVLIERPVKQLVVLLAQDGWASPGGEDRPPHGQTLTRRAKTP